MQQLELINLTMKILVTRLKNKSTVLNRSKFMQNTRIDYYNIEDYGIFKISCDAITEIIKN